MNRLLRAERFVATDGAYILMAVTVLLAYMLVAVSEPPGAGPGFTISMDEPLVTEEQLQAALESGSLVAVGIATMGMVVCGAVVAGLVCIVFAVLRFRRRRPLLASNQPVDQGPWHMWDVLKVAILFGFIGLLVQLLEGVVFAILHWQPSDSGSLLLINTAAMDVLALVLIYRVVCRQYRASHHLLGLHCRDWARNVMRGIVGYLTLFPLLVGSLLVIMWITKVLGYEPPAQPIFELFYGEHARWVTILTVLFVGVAGPVIEEVFFRGFAYRALKLHVGSRRAILISAVLFSALHGNLVGFFPIMLLGVLLAYLYERSGSLIPSFTVHVLHNSGIAALVLLTKALDQLPTP